MSVLSVRLDTEMEEKINLLMKNRHIVDKSAFIRQLLDKSLSEELLQYYCEIVNLKKMSAWKAAEKLGISLREFLHQYKSKGFETYTHKEFLEDLEFVMND